MADILEELQEVADYFTDPDQGSDSIGVNACKGAMCEIEHLRAELDEARGIAAAAYQSWKGNRFDVEGNQRALSALGLKWSGSAVDTDEEA